MAVTPAARPARPRAWPGVAACALWTLTMLGLVLFAWLEHLLRRAGRPELTWPQAGTVPLGAGAVSAATVGAVLASRRPRHPVGWLLLALGLSLSGNLLTAMYVRYGVMARPGALPAASYVAGFSLGILVISFSCAGFVLLLTPTGSLPSPRWRWWARVAAVATADLRRQHHRDRHRLLSAGPDPRSSRPAQRKLTGTEC